jgi:hypothetical protein
VANDNDVRVRIVVDTDAAKKATEELTHEMDKAGEHGSKAAEHAESAWAENVEHIVEFAGGELLAEGVKKMGEELVDLAKEAAEAFIDDQRAVRQLAGTFAMLDDGSDSIESINFGAGQLKNELEEVGIEAGQTAAAITGAFNDILERGGHTIDETMHLTEALSQAGRAVPGGPGQLAEAFSNIEMGIIRARNPLVQMISATGMLHGNAKAVAKEMSKMTVEQQIDLAEKAVGRMSERMKAMPRTWDENITSIKGVIEKFMEEMGRPIVAPIMTAVDMVRGFLVEHGEEIEAVFTHAGDILGDMEQTVLTDLLDNAEQLEEIWANLSTEVTGIGDEFAGMSVDMKDVLDVVQDIQVVLHYTTAIAKAQWEIVLFIVEKVGKVLKAIGEELGLMTPGPAAPSGLSDEESKKRAAFAAESGIDESSRKFEAAYDRHGQAIKAASDAHEAVVHVSASEFTNVWDWARKTHDRSIQQNIAATVAGSEAMRYTLGVKGPEIFGEGVNDFLKALSASGPEGKKAAEELKKAWFPKGVATGPPTINFNNNTFQIKQDFRDQDPDRVVAVFRRDLVRQSTDRLQARVATPWGL